MGCEFRESKPSLIAVARSGVHCHCVNVRLHLCKLLQVPIDFGVNEWYDHGVPILILARDRRDLRLLFAVHMISRSLQRTSGQ